jgi:hypothetical protein
MLTITPPMLKLAIRGAQLDLIPSMLASSAVDRGFEPRSGQTKDYEIGICCFSAKHAALRRKSKDWLARNQNNVSEWTDYHDITEILLKVALNTMTPLLSLLKKLACLTFKTVT